MSFWKKLFGGSASPTPKTRQAPVAAQVTFLREVRKQHPITSSIQTITKLYSAANREEAAAFLRSQNITEEFVYIVVETPSGIFGIDRMGEIYIYDSGGPEMSDWQDLSRTFHDTASEGNLDKVRVMLKDNPNLVFSKAGDEGETPLQVAAGNGHKEVVELLLDKGADINVRDQNGLTALHDSAHNGHRDVVKLLLDKGADVNAKMYGGYTPLHWAVVKGHKDVEELLYKHGGACTCVLHK